MIQIIQQLVFAMLLSASQHSVAAAPVTPAPVAAVAVHAAVAKPAARKAVVAASTEPIVKRCPVDVPDGYVAWYPGEVAPYELYGSTVDYQVHYSAPDGYVVLIKRWSNDDGSLSSATYMVPLPSC